MVHIILPQDIFNQNAMKMKASTCSPNEKVTKDGPSIFLPHKRSQFPHVNQIKIQPLPIFHKQPLQWLLSHLVTLLTHKLYQLT